MDLIAANKPINTHSGSDGHFRFSSLPPDICIMILQYTAWLSLHRIQPNLTNVIWATNTNSHDFPSNRKLFIHASRSPALLILLHFCDTSRAIFVDFVKECEVITYNEHPPMNSGVPIPKPTFCRRRSIRLSLGFPADCKPYRIGEPEL